MDRNPPPVSSYIVAQNPEVLVHLLKETESRGINPSVYTTPASAFNTIAVDFKENTGSGCSEFSNTDKTISVGNSLQSLNSLSSDISVAHSSVCVEPPAPAPIKYLTQETCAAIAGSAAIINKSLPRNFGFGGGSNIKFSAHKRAIGDGASVRKSFSISSSVINEPLTCQSVTLARIPQRMSRSVDSTSIQESFSKEEVEVRTWLLRVYRVLLL